MEKINKPEVWLRGPLNDVPDLLQPVAHALLQAREEVNAMMIDFPADLLWHKLAGMATVGFHLQHLTGVLDRLFTYANGRQLTEAQLTALATEGKADGRGIDELIAAFNMQVDYSINKLVEFDEQTLTQRRGVGRAAIPSTVIGLLVHSAEHIMRHTGQLLVTVKVLKAGYE